jgi:hypothetical protein
MILIIEENLAILEDLSFSRVINFPVHPRVGVAALIQRFEPHILPFL